MRVFLCIPVCHPNLVCLMWLICMCLRVLSVCVRVAMFLMCVCTRVCVCLCVSVCTCLCVSSCICVRVCMLEFGLIYLFVNTLNWLAFFSLLQSIFFSVFILINCICLVLCCFVVTVIMLRSVYLFFVFRFPVFFSQSSALKHITSYICTSSFWIDTLLVNFVLFYHKKKKCLQPVLQCGIIAVRAICTFNSIIN